MTPPPQARPEEPQNPANDDISGMYQKKEETAHTDEEHADECPRVGRKRACKVER